MTDRRVPGYLGRVLGGAGEPTGTCFQVQPGVLVTACHVLDDLGAADPGAVVRVDALAGGVNPFDATVARVDPIHDLAVLTSDDALTADVAGWATTDWVARDTRVDITGVSKVDDPGHEYRHLDASGDWAGGTTRDDQVPLGRLAASAVLPGMSGAPVVRRADGLVVGVVSGRYNSIDGWLRDSVWIARVENLEPLLAEVAPIEPSGRPRFGGAVDLTFAVSDTTVRLRGGGVDETAPHAGVRSGLVNAVDEVRRERALRGTGHEQRTDLLDPITVGTPTRSVSLRRAGELTAESFLPRPVADTLAAVLRQAEAEHVPVRIGVEPGAFRALPWEAMPDPVGGQPLALHPLITVYRKVPAQPVREIPGPLRILIAIAAPDEDGVPVLDYERELRNVLKAVKTARADADVRIVDFATTAAIRAELERAPAHVLHISGHGKPGRLILEEPDGSAREVSAENLLAEAIPAGQMPPVISLAACYTDVAGEADAPTFAAELAAHGASAVIATETSVTDRYATVLFARVYEQLANADVPDVVAAVAEARRTIQRQWAISPDPVESRLSALDEWSVVTVLAADGGVRVYDPTVVEKVIAPERASVTGLVHREIGSFIGRRRERRTLPAVLAGTQYAGVVLHGIGGVGKTTLAEQLASEASMRVVTVVGALNIDGLLSSIADPIRRALQLSDDPGAQMIVRAAKYVSDVSEPWSDRIAMLRDHIFSRVPVLVVLDNFEDNLNEQNQVSNKDLADLLATWLAAPGRSHLLITSRFAFPLPNAAHERMLCHQVGPLSPAETLKLVWHLPALNKLDDAQVEKVWRLVGGHPRSLEYLDAVLSGGTAHYSDVTQRLKAKVEASPEARAVLTPTDDLDVAIAAVATEVADEVLLDDLLGRLSPDARRVLLGASVYRQPVDLIGLLFQVGDEDPSAELIPDRKAASERILAVFAEAGLDPADLRIRNVDVLPPAVAAQLAPHFTVMNAQPRPPRSTALDMRALVHEGSRASLLAVVDAAHVYVHRCTATELAGRTGGTVVAAAHRGAAEYYLWHFRTWNQDSAADLSDLREARFHSIAAGDIGRAMSIAGVLCDRLHTCGAYLEEAALVQEALAVLPSADSERSYWYRRLSDLAIGRGDHAEARLYCLRALAIDEESGNRSGSAASYRLLGMLASERSDYPDARRHHSRALAIHQELGNRVAVANEYRALAGLAYRSCDYPEAKWQYLRALAISEEHSDYNGMAESYHNLGVLSYACGDQVEAKLQYTRALTMYEGLGDQLGVAGCHNQLGLLAHDGAAYSEALRHYLHAAEIFEELGHRTKLAVAYHNLGLLAFGNGDHSEASRQYLRSLAISEELGNLAHIATTLCQLGILAQARGEHLEAERLYVRALSIQERLGNHIGMAAVYSQLGILETSRGNIAAAVAVYLRAVSIRQEVGVRQALADIDVLSRIRQADGDTFRRQIEASLPPEGGRALYALLDDHVRGQAK